MNITRLEQETIVNFNAAEDTASVYTADPVYMRKLDKLCEREPASYKLVKRDKDGKWYEMPKRLVRFATTRIMTDEQKEAAAERKPNIRRATKTQEADRTRKVFFNSIFFRRSTDNHTPKLYQYNCEAYKQPASPGFS